MAVRMVMRRHKGEWYFCPEVYCDQCGEQITRDGNALYLIDGQGPVTGELFYLHKGACDRTWAAEHPAAAPAMWCWEELRILVKQLGASLGAPLRPPRELAVDRR